MEQQSSDPEATGSSRTLGVKTLLGLHVVIPVCVALALVDAALLGGTVADVLPQHPDQIVAFTLIFNLPHIIASELILLDGEYARKYGWIALAVIVATVLAAGVVPYMVSGRVFRAAILAVTLVHVVGQQVGIAGMLGRVSGTALHRAWRWSFTAVTLLVYARWTPGVGIGPNGEAWHTTAVWIGVALVTVLVWLLHRRAAPGDGRAYLWSTHAVLLGLAGLADLGYPCLALLIPRFVHDATAWSFYVVHDMNRNRERRRNLLYRALGFTRLPVWIIGPVVALGLAAAVGRIEPVVVAGMVAGILSLVHYVLEAITWRKTGLYRFWVPVVPWREA